MTRPRASAVSRSALPLPCAIQVPPVARITGSSAVTRPLAGRVHSMPTVSFWPRSQFHNPRALRLRRMWMYGSRLATTISRVPFNESESVDS